LGLSCGTGGEAAGHQEDGGPFDEGFMVFGETFVVAGAATAAGGPGVGALDGLTARQDLEAALAGGLLDDVDGDAELSLRPVAPVAVVGVVCPGAGQAAPAAGAGPLEHQGGPGAVLGAGGGDRRR
jgi:hypothetical protein